MRIVYFGSGAFGVPTLRMLAEEHDLAMVVTQPDRPAGRGGRLRATPVGEWVATHHPEVPVVKPQRVNRPELRDAIRRMDAEAWIVIAFGQKLGGPLLDGVFAVNLHASLLPRWRGAAPIHHAIMAGDTETGNSVITLAEEMDAGDVLGSSVRDIGPEMTTGDLHDLLAEDGPALVNAVLSRRASGELHPEPQDASRITLAPKLSRADAVIDWAEPADRVRATINGLSPWPGCQAVLAGRRLKLLRCRVAEPGSTRGSPGTVLDVSTGLVACGTGTIELLEVQPEGGRAMPFAACARGRSIEAGSLLVGDES
ncbi:MAG: methionyl-tRNA formyltransferase [Phycisphaerales bacterium]